MKLAIAILAGLILVCAAQPSLKVAASAPARMRQPSQDSPRIIKARVEGKKLIVEGEGFSSGAVVLINGEKQKTKSGGETSGNILIVKKAGKKIADGTSVTLQVANRGGGVSEGFDFFKGRVITLEDAKQSIRLSVGERFLIALEKESYEWTLILQNETVIREVKDSPRPPKSQGIFQAEQKGTAMISATGELPCHKLKPACLAPSLAAEFTFIVE
jgi:predicted secreted protein